MTFSNLYNCCKLVSIGIGYYMANRRHRFFIILTELQEKTPFQNIHDFYYMCDLEEKSIFI